MNIDGVRLIMSRMCDLIETKKEYLSDLDTAGGDGDHGLNMERGMKRIALCISKRSYDCIGSMFRDIAINFMDAGGGTSAALYGAMFMKMAEQFKGKATLDTHDVARGLRKAVTSMMKLGRAKPGDRTMVDVFDSAVAQLEAHADEGELAQWTAAALAAEAAVESTKMMTPTKGLARWDPDAAYGRPDAGAVSACCMFQAARDVIVSIS